MSVNDISLTQLEVNNIRTPLRDTGGDVSEAVLFVHGNPGSGADWQQTMQSIKSFTRAVAPDMPGFGEADKPADFNYTVEGYAEHLDGIINALGLERVHLVVHDFGGPWGLAWAANNVERVASLTEVNTGILEGYRWHYMARLWRAPLIGELVMATTTRFGFSMLMKHGNPRGLPKAFVDEMYQNFDSGTRRAVLKLYRATSADSETWAQLSAALQPADIETLVVWGKCDPYLPHPLAEAQKKTFPRAEIHYLDDSGHWPFIDNPEAFEKIIKPFLQRVTG